MNTERIAVIDLGTNTFHLLIAENTEKGLVTLYSEKNSVCIGKDGINRGLITDEASGRALATMHAFKAKLKEFQPATIVAIATSAFRNASNGPRLAEQLKQETGISISIISGEREAELIYLGVKEAVAIPQKALIIDIGGGSVEFILADDKTVYWKKSLEIGGQRLMEKFQTQDPMGIGELNALEHYLSEALEPLSEALQQFPTHELIGSSGSFDTFVDINSQEKGITLSSSSRKEVNLDLSDFYKIYQNLITKNRAERMEIPGMIDLRVDMIVVAAVLVRFLIETFDFSTLRVSSYALKEGVMSLVAQGKPVNE